MSTHNSYDMVFNTKMEDGAKAIFGVNNTINIGTGENTQQERSEVGINEGPVIAEERYPTQETSSFEHMMKKGYVMLIHNDRYPRRAEVWRTGSERDARELKQFFQTFCDFKFVDRPNKTASEINEIAADLSELDFTKYDSLFVIILSHGRKEGVVGVDEEVVPIASITGHFTAEKCPTLKHKPKFFIIQACRGDKDDPGAVAADAEPMQGASVTQTIPIESDFLICFACPPGYSSYRDEEHGSWYIQSLVEKLKEFHKTEHIMDIMLRVNYDVAGRSCDENFKQIPSQECRLTKKCFFAVEQ